MICVGGRILIQICSAGPFGIFIQVPDPFVIVRTALIPGASDVPLIADRGVAIVHVEVGRAVVVECWNLDPGHQFSCSVVVLFDLMIELGPVRVGEEDIATVSLPYVTAVGCITQVGITGVASGRVLNRQSRRERQIQVAIGAVPGFGFPPSFSSDDQNQGVATRPGSLTYNFLDNR